MDGFCLTDWCTLRTSQSSGVPLTQGHSSYLDVSEFDDIVLYLDVREVTGVVSMVYQTAPSGEDSSFVPIVPEFNVVAASTPLVTRVFAAYAPTPLAKFLRWQLFGTGATCDVTFRITFAAYAPGM